MKPKYEAMIAEIKQRGYRLRFDKTMSWAFYSDLSCLVLCPESILIKANKILPEDKLDKWLYDPFFGFFPHETNECVVTHKLMQHDIEYVKKTYPKYKFSKTDLLLIKENPPIADADIKRRFVGKEDIAEYTSCGGIAHEIIISDNWNAYDKWITKCYKLGLLV